MASVGYSGMILASKGAENEDGEEEMDDFIRPDDEDIDMDDPEREEKKRKRKYDYEHKD